MFCIEVLDEKDLPMVIAKPAGPWRSDVKNIKLSASERKNNEWMF
jgi:hypothetical protein